MKLKSDHKFVSQIVIDEEKDPTACDFTSPIYIKIKPVKHLDDAYHAAHIFGHWLCDMHAMANTYVPALCDVVADVIAGLVISARKEKENAKTSDG